MKAPCPQDLFSTLSSEPVEAVITTTPDSARINSFSAEVGSLRDMPLVLPGTGTNTNTVVINANRALSVPIGMDASDRYLLQMEEERLAGVVMTMTTHPPIGANRTKIRPQPRGNSLRRTLPNNLLLGWLLL